MPRGLPLFRSALGCAAALILATSPAASQSTDNFYSGKTITLTVGFTPGGGYDLFARLLARHLGNHIPGKPTVVVRNMPGAASLTSVLTLDTTAPADGTQIVTFNSGLLNDTMAEGDKARVKFNSFAWLGSMTTDLRVCVTSKSSAIQSFDDLLKGKPAVCGAVGATSSSAANIAMLRKLFNLSNLRMVTGYPGSAETHLATERGEVDGVCTSWGGLPDAWVTGKTVNVLIRLSPGTVPEIPATAKYIGDLVSTAEQKTLVEVLVSSGELARPFIMSKKVPAERLEILRKAFNETMTDKDLLAEAAKANLIIDAVDGPKAQRITDQLYSLPADVADKARAILKD